MKQSLVPDANSVPVSDQRRVSTDVICTIIGALFALAMFIVACIFYNSDGLNNAYFNFAPTATNPIAASSTDYYGFQTAFWATVLTAFGLGLIWLAWVHLFPRIAPHTAFILAILSLIALGVITLVVPSNFFNNNNTWKIITAVFCFVLAVILFCMFWFYSNALRIQGIFLDYARQFLHEVKGTFAYIFIFLLFLTGLIALIVFQHVAFSSKSHSNSNFWDFTNPGFLGILNILQFIWAFQFLRDAFNFCVSGAATNWYWSNGPQVWYTPLVRLFTRHWGSVVGGSFLNAFFEIPTLIVELLTCHKTSCCRGLGTSCDERCCWGYFFNLVRTDSYSYINLTSLPFCNSGRACYDLCINSNIFIGGYNPMKHYRFAASVFLTTLGYLLAHIYANKRVLNFTWWHNVILVIIVYAVICWFVNIDADAAEGISTSFLYENLSAQGRFEDMHVARQVYRDDIAFRTKRDSQILDGHC